MCVFECFTSWRNFFFFFVSDLLGFCIVVSYGACILYMGVALVFDVSNEGGSGYELMDI